MLCAVPVLRLCLRYATSNLCTVWLRTLHYALCVLSPRCVCTRVWTTATRSCDLTPPLPMFPPRLTPSHALTLPRSTIPWQCAFRGFYTYCRLFLCHFFVVSTVPSLPEDKYSVMLQRIQAVCSHDKWSSDTRNGQHCSLMV
ncbi:hypothetical protein EDD15DRAFT_2239306 [Pisolithus albus]|nr:hypothetical protein EDD15DRAFT_2239306 [Pisolithus albus]